MPGIARQIVPAVNHDHQADERDQAEERCAQRIDIKADPETAGAEEGRIHEAMHDDRDGRHDGRSDSKSYQVFYAVPFYLRAWFYLTMLAVAIAGVSLIILIWLPPEALITFCQEPVISSGESLGMVT